MNISSNFDSGNIEVRSINDSKNIELKINKDTKAESFQWFHFRLQDAMARPCKMNILNAADCSYPEGWEDYQARASYDRINWFMVPTSFDGQVLSIEHTPEYNSVFYALFAPYSYEQHLDLVNSAQLSQYCVIESLGKTVEGRDIDLLIIGNPADGKKKIWITARQHPGETMASWFIEGLINRLLDDSDPVSRKLLDEVDFYIIPNMNIDGSIAGNLRTNTLGVNFNREWENPNKEKSPEVYYVRQKMDETGVDLNFDIHGDEGLPCNFISSIEGIPAYNKKLGDLLSKFKNSWLLISPDFQDEMGYPKNEAGTANLKICSKQIGQRFNCLSMTIEMPFKDNKFLPDPVYGWSPDRSERLGESLLTCISIVVDEL